MAGRRRRGGGEVAGSPGSLAQSFHATKFELLGAGLFSAPSTWTEEEGLLVVCLLSKGFEAAQVPGQVGRRVRVVVSVGAPVTEACSQAVVGGGCGWWRWRWWPRGVVTEGRSRAARSDHWDHWDHEGIGGRRSSGGSSWSPRGK